MEKMSREKKAVKLLRDSQDLIKDDFPLTEICTRCEKVTANIERAISLIREERRNG